MTLLSLQKHYKNRHTKSNRFRILKLGNESNQHPHGLFCVLSSHPADMKLLSVKPFETRVLSLSCSLSRELSASCQCLASRWRGDTKSDRQETRIPDFGSSEKVTSFLPKGKMEHWNRFWSSACSLNCNKKPSPKTLLVGCLQRCAHPLLYIVLSFLFLHFFAYQEVEQLLL